MEITANHSETLKIITGKWPDLPVAFKNGISNQVGDIAYLGLGTAKLQFFRLDLNDPSQGWQPCQDFIGPQTFGAASAVSGGKIYVFSGNGMANAQAKSATIFDTVYVYCPSKDHWSKLKTKTPVGLSGAQALALDDGRIALIGGYNKHLFDTYLAALAVTNKDEQPKVHAKLVHAYMGMQPTDYKWNRQVFIYDPATNSWCDIGENPFLPNCDACAIKLGESSFKIIGGEIKPGLRTAVIKTLEIDGNDCKWTRLADLPPASTKSVQEGPAGAFAARFGAKIILAGGVNFNGARANFASGKTYAHQGLEKQWHRDIYIFDGSQWHTSGSLPIGLGYGASFSHQNSLLIVGGEDSGTNAHNSMIEIALNI